VELKEMQSFL
jgi:hypothetical protein